MPKFKKEIKNMSKKVKLVIIEEFSDDDYSQSILREGITDWEELTDEEYSFLHNELNKLIQVKYPYRVGIVTLVDDSIHNRIINLKDKIQKEMELKNKKQLKFQEERRLRNELKEKKLLEELEAKYRNKE